ncbi:hypothetical protein Tco_0020190 [Tanacetum coccineum]
MNELQSKELKRLGCNEISRSMKNSEEEEYMWDDVTSVSVNPTASTSSKRDPRFFFDIERPDLENNFQKTQRAHDLGLRLDRESLTSLRSKGSSLTNENGRLGVDGKAARSQIIDLISYFSLALSIGY